MIFSNYLRMPFLNLSRNIHISSSHKTKVAVLGANGNVGQCLSLLLKRSLDIDELSLYDIKSVKGLVTDLSHIPKPARVVANDSSITGLSECIKDSTVVVIVAGNPRSPGMTRANLFTTNALIVADLAYQCAKINPKCMMCIVTNPINSLVPMVAQIYRALSVYDPCRLFGITNLDSIRANTFVAKAKDLIASDLCVPVIGGHSETTLIPVISQCVPSVSFPPEERYAITRRIQMAGTDLLEAKAGKGSSTLSIAYAVFKFVNSLIEGLGGKKGVVQCAYVESSGGPCEFFASPLIFGPNGIHRNIGVGRLIDFEQSLLKNAIPELQECISQGKKFGDEFMLSKKHL